ncbi:MAG: MBL fold metallo-hydrolase [Promethearchaeota archaeon]|nr:MAG: MBL fold metallo-hydrolase [Candidatus Lokiarchaeota archaeon]
MKIKRIISEGLAHISYLLISERDACVIDPRRDAKVYLQKAYKEEVNLKYIFETHRNEDYVIGSMELADIIDIEIFHGPGLDWKYGTTLKDNQEFELGSLKIKAIHTPGHTDESTSFAVYQPDIGTDTILIFTGDTLFIGDTGRIDMYGPHQEKRLAENLYHSLFDKILPLGDQAIILPAHGAGSVCGAAISNREYSTIGLEKSQNPALQYTKKEDFINFKLTENHYYIPYFQKMEKLNLEGPPLLRNVKRFKPLEPEEFRLAQNNGAVVLDTREPSSFGGAHIPGSYNIWLEGLPSYAGWVIPYENPLLLVVRDFKNLNKVHRYLLRLGYDNIMGYLTGGLKAWYSQNYPIDSLGLITAKQLKNFLDQDSDIYLLDVRSLTEREEGYIKNSKHIYFGYLPDRLNEIPNDKLIITYCGNGSRASLAASILKKAGFDRVSNFLGSMIAWLNAGYPIITN